MEDLILSDIKGSTNSLDPRSKILITIIYITGVAISVDYFQIFLYVMLYIPLIIIFKPRLVFVRRIIFPLLIISLVALFLYIGIQTNEVNIEILGYRRPYAKISFVGLIIYRYMVIILFNYMLLHSEDSHTEIIEALASFKLGTTMITILLLIKRISNTVTDDYQKMLLAARSKGAFGRNPLRNIFIRMLILGRIFARTTTHSDIISKSLIARGFYDEFVPTIRPWSSEGITLTILSFIFFVNITIIPWVRLS